MIVLDEQLKRRRIARSIRQWYKGKVVLVTELRIGTMVADEAISSLLRQVRQPTFVTMNVDDFWRVIDADEKYAVVCLKVTYAGVPLISPLLRQLLSTDPFLTKRQRMGHAFRINRDGEVQFYRHGKPETQRFFLRPPTKAHR